MEKALPLELRNISEIYLESQETKTYMIPVYQRNYAWEEDEITALIKDVYDAFLKSPDTPYYIGTLVTYKRGDSEYEVIDGQQRLTTIYIILKAMKVKDIRNNLSYRARKASASTIQHLDSYPDLGDEVDGAIRNGYKYAAKALAAIVSEGEWKGFEQYFLEQVSIIHYMVPKDVDLNHYFEVMNSRGEQLEKHEIVKSILCEKLKDDKKEVAVFSRVWEACSEMNIYIQQAFSLGQVFWNDFQRFVIHSFKDIPEQDGSEGRVPILDLLHKSAVKLEDKSDKEQSDRFQPIIDFPNFLLIVLKITLMGKQNFNPAKFTLDDKELLNEFNKALAGADDGAEFARSFAFNLLKARYFLDNYIVHHSLGDKEKAGDNPWKLQYYQESGNSRQSKNLTEVQKELVHLLSMFEVSFTPKQRKNYLFYCLLFLFGNGNVSKTDYLRFLRLLADKYFYDVYLNRNRLNERNQPVPNAFDDALLNNGALDTAKAGDGRTDYREQFLSIYRQGRSDIPLFVFNYTDYILWKKYADTLRGKNTKRDDPERVRFFQELDCSDFDLEPFSCFYFSRTRKTLEHFYPQAKAGEGMALSTEEINCFGNFAMIGSEANSSGSNWNPKTKLEHYLDGKTDQVSVASLKFRIMMQKCLDNSWKIQNSTLTRDAGMEWDATDMQEHQRVLLGIIIPPSD